MRILLPSGVQTLEYQRRLVETASRFTWSCWGRQTGKSFALSLRRVIRGIARRKTQIIVSAGMRQCRELLQKVQQHCHTLQIVTATEALEGMRGSSTQIRLPRGVRVIALPARPETVRGFSGDVLLDEFAMHGNDREIWAAIFPTILRGDGELDIASTPKGKGNLFYELRGNESFERTTVTLPEAIGQGLDLDMEALRRAMGDEELFRQEFLCEFLDESEAFLPYSVIAACEDEEVDKQIDWAALQGSRADVYAGVDVARKCDLTVIWLWQQQQTRREQQPESQPRLWSLRCVGMIEMARAPFGEQQEMIRRVLELRCVRGCCIDATGMGWPLAEWAQDTFGSGRVEGVTFTAGLKAQMASQLRRLAEERRLAIPAGEESIRNDWHSVRRSVNASGGLRLDAAHSEHGHADRFWAAALGAYAVEAGSAGPVEWQTVGTTRGSRWG